MKTAWPSGVRAAALTLAVLALSACARQGAQNKPPEPGDKAVASTRFQEIPVAVTLKVRFAIAPGAK